MNRVEGKTANRNERRANGLKKSRYDIKVDELRETIIRGNCKIASARLFSRS